MPDAGVAQDVGDLGSVNHRGCVHLCAHYGRGAEVEDAVFERLHAGDTQTTGTMQREIVGFRRDGSIEAREHELIVQQALERLDVGRKLGTPDLDFALQNFVVDAHVCRPPCLIRDLGSVSLIVPDRRDRVVQARDTPE
jgi:hypothetical protein